MKAGSILPAFIVIYDFFCLFVNADAHDTAHKALPGGKPPDKIPSDERSDILQRRQIPFPHQDISYLLESILRQEGEEAAHFGAGHIAGHKPHGQTVQGFAAQKGQQSGDARHIAFRIRPLDQNIQSLCRQKGGQPGQLCQPASGDPFQSEGIESFAAQEGR